MRIAAITLSGVIGFCAHAGDLSRATDQLPELADPPEGQAQWIAKSMKVNGLPMTLKAFESAMDPLALLHHYERWFRGLGALESRVSRNGDRHILAIKHQRYFATIQAQPSTRGSVGTMTVSANPATVVAQLDTKFPVLKGLRIINLQQYEDLGVEAEHISLVSSRAAHVDATSYEQLLTKHGWQIVRQQATRATLGGQLVEAQRGAEHALLTFLPDRTRTSATAIVIVWRKA